MHEEYYLQLLIECLAMAVIAEAAVDALKLPVAAIKMVAKTVFNRTWNRVKPLDCGFCMAFWIALFNFGLDPIAIAGVILFRQIIHRLLLF